VREEIAPHTISQPDAVPILNSTDQFENLPHSDEIHSLGEGFNFSKPDDMYDYSAEGLYQSLLI